MGLPKASGVIFLLEPASPVGVGVGTRVGVGVGRGLRYTASSLIGEPIRPVDQKGSLPPAIRTWGVFCCPEIQGCLPVGPETSI